MRFRAKSPRTRPLQPAPGAGDHAGRL